MSHPSPTESEFMGAARSYYNIFIVDIIYWLTSHLSFIENFSTCFILLCSYLCQSFVNFNIHVNHSTNFLASKFIDFLTSNDIFSSIQPLLPSPTNTTSPTNATSPKSSFQASHS